MTLDQTCLNCSGNAGAPSQVQSTATSRKLDADAGESLRPHKRTSADTKLVIINLIAVLVPPLGLVSAVLLLWGEAFNWYYLLILGGMSCISAVGITVGYHRLCTHKSFTTSAVLRYLFAAAGSMAVQGPVIRWCAEHRKHHQHSDTEHDPHSPHMSKDGSWGDGIRSTLRGAFHAHVGWLFKEHSKGLGKYSADLKADRALVLADRQFVHWVIVGLVFPAMLGALISMSWWGLLLGFLWGGLVRIFLVHHITWSVNSVCHLWGTQPFDSRDESRNNAIVALLAMGEGWHNNHHAFPTSARHGLRWWEIDVSYVLIRFLAHLRLASNVRVPSPERVRGRRTNQHRDVPSIDTTAERIPGRDRREIPKHIMNCSPKSDLMQST